jgi:hypothetical protein
MNINIEYIFSDNGTKFLNYWDSKNGNDVCCEIIDNKLFLMQFDEKSNELPPKEISFFDFLKMIEKNNK